MQSKNAMGNLKNRYISVLKKCSLLNLFGSLAVVSALTLGFGVSTALAELVNLEGNTVSSMNATNQSFPSALFGIEPFLTNNGTISGGDEYTISSRSFIVGMFGNDSTGTISYNFTNNGTIAIDYTATSGSAYAYGMYAWGGSSHTLTNSGTITVIANGGTASSTSGSVRASADAYAHGMYAYGNSNHTLTNNDTITFTVNGGTASSTSGSAYADASADAYAYGMYAYGNSNHTLTNSGIITVTATGGTASSTSADAYASAYADAYGMFAYGNSNHTLTNSGTITVTANGGTATSTSGSAYASASAYGMYVSGTPTAGTFHLLTNTGVINASASVQTAGESARAYEAYGSNSFTVDTWATTLRDWSANDAVFGLDNGEILTFANGTEGASLIVRPDTAANGFVLGKAYNVAEMVAIDVDPTFTSDMQLQTTINGSIAEVKTEVDLLTATLGGTTSAPTVSLSLNTTVLPTSAIAGATLNGHIAHLNGVSDVTKNAIASVYNNAFDLAQSELEETAQAENQGIAAGSHALAEMPKWTVFATPYGSYTDNSEYNYDSGTYGISGGATYNFSEKFALGGHVDFNASNADSNNLESDSYSFALGTHAHYFFNPNWYVSGNATFAFGNNDIKYTHTFGNTSDEFGTSAFFAGLHTGYIFEINESNIVVPEIGFSYLYGNTDGYNLHFAAPYDMYNMSNQEVSYSNLYADLTVTWQGNYAIASSVLSPSAGFGIRQNLTGSDISSSFDMFGARYETLVSSDSTTFLANAGLEWTHGNFSVSADYKGEFGSEQTSHTGSLNFTFKF